MPVQRHGCLQPQGVPGPQAAWDQPFLLSLVHKQLPHPRGVLRRHVNLHPVFSRVSCPGDNTPDIPNHAVKPAGIVLIRNFFFGHLLKDIHGLWPLKGQLGHAVGNILKHHIPKLAGLHPGIVLILIGSVHNNEVAVVPYLIDNQVVHHASLFVAHGAVSRLSLCHDRIIIGQQHVQVLKRILSPADDLTHV